MKIFLAFLASGVYENKNKNYGKIDCRKN